MAQTNQEIANTLARKDQFRSATFVKKWHGIDLFVAYLKGDELQYVGQPQYILIDAAGIARWSTPDETNEILGIKPRDKNFTDSFI